MYTKKVLQPSIIWYFSWKMVVFSAFLSGITVYLYHAWNMHGVAVPFLPIATVGTAVAFYVGFKNNSSYDRLWESRKIWGEITNTSRTLVSYLMAVMPTGEGREELTHFVYRQIAYVNMLRLQLRRRNMWDESDEYTRMSRECFDNRPFEESSYELLHGACPKDEIDDLMLKNNIALALLKIQMKALNKFKNKGWIDDFEQSDLLRYCGDLCASQGRAERIKSFPFPRQYAFFSEVFVYMFVCLLPFGLIGEFAKISSTHEWLTIPFSVLISFVFITMEKVGDTSENPFENSINDVPMTAICRNIEIDLKSMLGESNLPAALQADDNVLM